MARTQIIDEELNGVATHLEAQRASADADPQLTTANALPRLLLRCNQPEPAS